MTLTNKQVREALLGSIRKWEAIVAGKGTDESMNNCSLCKMFSSNRLCDGCPVAVDTEQEGCLGSPWEDWMYYCTDVLRQGWGNFKVKDKGSQSLAQDELDYLKSLDKKFFQP